MLYTRISADCHIDMPWLPPDLFTANASALMKDRVPYVVDGPDGSQWTTKKGAPFGLVGGIGSTGTKYVPGQNQRVDVMASTGLYDDGKKGIRRPGDPHLRVKDMDRDGVQAEVLFGNLDAAVKEIHRVARMGLRGLELSCSWDMEPMWHQMWEPLWQAVNDVNLPLHFHTFPSLPPGVRERQTGLTRRAAFFTSVAGFQMNLVNILAAVIGAGVLERYPNIRISFGESGIGWIPYALDRMDFEWEDRFRDLGLKMRPSEYWRRQCKATFQFDPIGTKLIDDIGVETLMWGSDYPHPDGVWPQSSKYIAEQFGHLPPDVVSKITCENAGKFYGLIN